MADERSDRKARRRTFRMIPDPMIIDRGLSDGAKMLYVVMLMMARSKAVLTGASVSDITAITGQSQPSFNRQIRELEHRGWIARIKRQSRYFEVEFVEDWPDPLSQKRLSAHSVKNDRVDSQKRLSRQSKMIECAGPSTNRNARGIQFNSNTRETRETQPSVVAQKGPEKPRKKAPRKDPLLFETDGLPDPEPLPPDDPETASLIASMHPIILRATVNQRFPQGKPAAVLDLENILRDWRRLNYPASILQGFLEQALETVRPFDPGPVERYLKKCCKTYASKRDPAPKPLAPRGYVEDPRYPKVTLNDRDRIALATLKGRHKTGADK